MKLIKNLKVAIMQTVLVIAFATNAAAYTDYTCASRCESQGYATGLCIRNCSY